MDPIHLSMGSLDLYMVINEARLFSYLDIGPTKPRAIQFYLQGSDFLGN